MFWELSGDRGDKWLNGVLPTWSVNPYKVRIAINTLRLGMFLGAIILALYHE